MTTNITTTSIKTTKATKATTTKRPSNYKKSDWDSQTYNVFFRVVEFTERKLSLSEFMEHADVTMLFSGCGVPCDEWHAFQLFKLMTSDNVSKGERKVKAINTLRSFFNGKWSEIDNMAVLYKAPAAPQVKKEKSTRDMTPEEKKNCVKNTFAKLSEEEKRDILEELMNALAA